MLGTMLRTSYHLSWNPCENPECSAVMIPIFTDEETEAQRNESHGELVKDRAGSGSQIS